jgi:HEAT repeat protein/TolA-binding protein
MKHGSFLLTAIVLPAAIAAAQVTPVPPTPPAAPPVPATAAPVVTPVAPSPMTAPLIGDPYLDRMQLDEIRRAADDARREAQRSVDRLDVDEIRRQAQLAAEDARQMSLNFQNFHVDIPQVDIPRIEIPRVEIPRVEIPQVEIPRIEIPPINVPGQFVYATPGVGMGRGIGSNNFSYNQSFSTFGEHFIQGDPADSIYQRAREAFNRSDYSRAAGLFADLVSKYPNYRRLSEAVYYEAFADYRVGTVDNLRQGLKVLESNSSRLAYDSRNDDAPALQARILRALIDRNEPGADVKLKELFAKYPTASCDKEAIGIKSTVLNSLYQTDPEAATPYIKSYLDMRDACSAELRRTAVFLLGQRPSEANTALLARVAETDTVKDVRTQAIEVLSRMPGDAAISALQQLMRDTSDRVSRAAVRALMRNDNTKARAALRTALLDKRDAPESQRIEAITSYDRDNTSPDDAAYLRNVYLRKDESDRVKSAVISTLSRIPSDENVQFLLGIANNANESGQLRAQALRSISRTTLSVPDLIKLYDNSDSRSMRQTLVEALNNRKEDAALNKMFDVVQHSTDPDVRRYAIQLLLGRNDPNVTKRVLDLISKGAS